MNKNVKVIYKKLTKRFEQLGYINLNHRLVNSNDDLVEIATIFRNPKYETFRMIYTKKNKIVGYESISSKHPYSVQLFRNNKGEQNQEKCFYKMQDRMQRLGADGYYMVHNHPSGNVSPSNYDISTTFNFIKNLQGFKGHLIIGTDTYFMLKKCPLNNKLKGSDVQPINFKKADKMAKFLSNHSIYDVTLHNAYDIVSLVQNLNRQKGYSIAMLTDSENKIRMILDIPNNMLNYSKEQLNGYFRNLAKENGVHSVFLATDDEKTFNKGLEHLQYGTFKDMICYKNYQDRIYIYKANYEKTVKELFGEEVKNRVAVPVKKKPIIPILSFAEMTIDDKINLKNQNNMYMQLSDNENDYIEIPVHNKEIDLDTEDTFEPNEHQIKVLYKRAGKKPIVKVIENTLEAKQQLVGGLIEVIPYMDNTLLVCNEEGKILNLKPNLCFTYDYIAGDCFVIGDDYKNAGFKSLTDIEIKKAKKDLMSKSFANIEEDKNKEKECSKQYTKSNERDI